MKKWILFIVCAFTLFTMSFGRAPVVHLANKSEINFTLDTTDLNPRLYPLIMKGDDFRKMIGMLKVKIPVTDRHKKIVFQFLYVDDAFTLGVYIGNKRQIGFNAVQDFTLDACKPCGAKAVVDNTTYLGDLEILNQQDSLKDLRHLASRKDILYFIFMPSIDGNTVPGKKVAKYQILYSTDAKGLANNFSAVTATGVYSNPSPPRKGN